MGKQSSIKLSGTVNDIIYYKSAGQYYVRTKPAKVQQTTATRTSAKRFGLAAATAKQIRIAIKELLLNISGIRMTNRLTVAVNAGLTKKNSTSIEGWQTIPELQHFSFNEKTTIKERLKLPLQTDWTQPAKLLLYIPAMDPAKDIAAPTGTLAVDISMVMVCTSMEKRNIISIEQLVLTVPYVSEIIPAQQKEWSLSWQPQQLCVLVMALRYIIKGQEETRLDWLPVNIIDAACCGD